MNSINNARFFYKAIGIGYIEFNTIEECIQCYNENVNMYTESRIIFDVAGQYRPKKDVVLFMEHADGFSYSDQARLNLFYYDILDL